MKNVIIITVALISMGAGAYFYSTQQPDFKLLSGEYKQWGEYRGDWLVINYFAEWCAPCLKEVPELNAFHHAIQGTSTKLFAVSYDAMPDTDLEQIKQKYSMQFPLLSSEFQATMPNPRPKQLPATYIINGEGELVKTLMGEQSKESLKAWVERLQGL